MPKPLCSRLVVQERKQNQKKQTNKQIQTSSLNFGLVLWCWESSPKSYMATPELYQPLVTLCTDEIIFTSELAARQHFFLFRKMVIILCIVLRF